MNYRRIYDNLIEKAKTRIPPEGYIERHHITPKCLGGEDTEENLVVLTPEEHYVAHQLLVKIHPNKGSLIYAANKMCVGHKGRRNNKRYGWLKRKYSEQRKKDSRGKENPQYGTMWINKIGTTCNRKIEKDEIIPDGWQKGRKLPHKRKYIHSPSQMVCKTIGYGDLVPEGWYLGRVTDWDYYFGKRPEKRVRKNAMISKEYREIVENSKRKKKAKRNKCRASKPLKKSTKKNKIHDSHIKCYRKFKKYEEEQLNARELFDMLKYGDFKSIREISRSDFWSKSDVALIHFLKKYIPEYGDYIKERQQKFGR